MRNYSIEQHVRQKKLIPCTPANADLEWQVYFGYLNAANRYGNQDYQCQHFYELLLVLQSPRKYFIHNTVYDVQYGDILLIPPDVQYKGLNLRNGQYERYYFYFHPNLFQYLPHGDLLSGIFRNKNRFLISFPSAERDQILAGFAAFQNSADLTPLDRIGLSVAVLDLLVRLNRRSVELGDYPPPPIASSPVLNTIIQHINANFASIGTIESVADKFSISRPYMSKLFREELRIAPYQYLQSIRIARAQSLLKNGASVTEACYAVGLNDCSRFISYFTRAIGMTPGEYRKKCQQNGEFR